MASLHVCGGGVGAEVPRRYDIRVWQTDEGLQRLRLRQEYITGCSGDIFIRELVATDRAQLSGPQGMSVLGLV